MAGIPRHWPRSRDCRTDKNSTLVAANPIDIAARQTAEPGFPTTIIEIPTTSCTFRPTATVTATTGCATTCTPTGICFADGTYHLPSDPRAKRRLGLPRWQDRRLTELPVSLEPVTLDCGCTSMAVQPTTVTVCPTATVCRQCQTGWGIVTVTPTTCPAQTPVPLPTA